jgi:glycerophosphoryl diester phosphodiesterase
VIGHRGAVLPGLGEETLAAMQRAVADGAAVLEFDVRWTNDGVAVALHGDALESVSNCWGSVTAWTAQDLAAQCTVQGQPIAHVSDLVAYAKQVQIPISPEVKPASITDAEAADLAAMLAGTTTYLQSFSTAVFAPLRAAGYAGPFVYLTTSSVSPEAVSTSGAAIVAQMFSGSLTAAQVRTYHDAGLQVWAWTARSTSELSAARTDRVDAVVADDPGAARTFYAAQRP